ncbi:unnamed protein product [Caenorhabditis auriculariae]|uniref:Uncharacterized protein n=1 Tax=Caenorhabditis auriculariae TaxID=2777116 RepID=A0A8S1H1K2_9PELO|nr:unnamed protein product [Caenorhabditis auriculariae]
MPAVLYSLIFAILFSMACASESTDKTHIRAARQATYYYTNGRFYPVQYQQVNPWHNMGNGWAWRYGSDDDDDVKTRVYYDPQTTNPLTVLGAVLFG